MSSSRHTRRQRQQQSLRRHRMKLERLEKRYALDAAAITNPADWGWAGVVENAKVFSVAQDSTGAVYTAGTFSGTIDLDFSASSSELISVGADDIFVAKYDSGGTFVWAKQFGSTGRDGANAITIDSNDNLRIGGHFEGTVDFDPGVGTETLTSAGAGDGYVLSLDADGDYLWAGRFGGVGTGSANGAGDFVDPIAVDGSGNTYVGGVIYQGSGPAVDVEFGTGSTTVDGSGQQNTIIIKIDTSGNMLWAKHFDSDFLNGPSSMDINTNGDIVIGGFLHSQPMDADPGPGVAMLNASGLSDAYIVVLDQDGNYRWAHEYGNGGEESIRGVATDASGNIYVNAYISGSVDLDPDPEDAESFTAVGSYDLVVVSFDSDGDYRWSESYGDASEQYGWGMTVNGQNELVVSGLFEGSLTLPAGSSVSAPASIGTGLDHFVLWLNTDNGQALKVTSLGTTSNDTEKIAVWDFGPNGLLVSGWLAGGGDVDFSPDSSGSIIAVPSGGTSYVRRMSAKSPWGYPLKEQPQGNWLHSSGTGPGQSSSWYPTAIPSNESLAQHGYATYWHHTGTPAGWFTQPTSSTNTFFVFETYVTSETTQSIDYLLGGNDGHSLFINDQFVRGAGFGNDNAPGTLSLQAGVPVKVTLVGYNSGADTHISFRTADLQNIEDIPGVSVSAKLLRVTSSEHSFELDNTKPTITGFGAPGASIEVFADLNRDGTTETSIGTTTVASDNSWSLTSDAWLPGGPVNVSATQDTGDSELSTADGVITVRTNRPGALVEVGADLLADGYINAAEAASNIVLRTPFDGSMISSGNTLWVFTDTGGNRTFALQTVGSTAPGNNYKDVGFSADLLREGPQAIDAWFTPTSSGGKAREVLSVTKDTIAPEATLGVSDVSIFSNETATVSISLSEAVNGLDVTDFVVSGGTLTNLSGASPNLTATFTPDVGFSGTATISIASDAFTDVAGNPNTASNALSVGVTVIPSAPTVQAATDLSGVTAAEAEAGLITVWNTTAGNTITAIVARGEQSVERTFISTGTNDQVFAMLPEEISLFGDGWTNVTVTQTDPAGNTSTGNGANFMLDLTPPAAPTVQAATDLSGVTAAEAEAGLITVWNTTAGNTITAIVARGEQSVERTFISTGTNDQVFAMLPEEISLFGDGWTNVTVTQTDPAGNTSTGNGANFMLDLTPLRVTSSEHAIELDDSKPTITGFGAPGASIEVFADLNRDGTTETSIGTTTVASDNSWSLTSDAWLPGGPVNVSATQDTGDSELSTADGVITVRSTRPGPLVEFGTNLLADGYINAAEAVFTIALRSPFDGSSVSGGASFWVFTDTGGNGQSLNFTLETVGSTAQANNYKDVSFSADLFREGGQVIDVWFLPTDQYGRRLNTMYVTKDTIAPEATLGISDASIFSNETATVSITLSEAVNGLDVTDFVVSGGTLTNLSGTSPNLTATFTPDVDFSGTATISIASDAFTDVAGNPNTASHSVITTVLPEILSAGELSRFEDEGIGGEFGVWTDAIAFAENRIASYVPTGSGFVRTWSLSESNEIVRTGDVFTPNTVASEGFGFSLVLDETILGIGSPQAVVNATHDGQFYLYEPATRASIATLNPQPHTAQYFGASSDISENDYFVVSETGNWDHDTSFGITFYGYDNAGQPTLLFRETIDPVGAPVAQYGGNLAVSGEYVVGGYHLETEKTFSLKVWQVNGSGAEATVSGWAPVEIETIDDFYNGRGEQRLATNGNLIVRSSSLSSVVNVFQIDPVGKTINHVTDIEAPPGVSGFGEAVTFTDNKLFIGAPSATGESYVFIYDVNDSGIQGNGFISSSSLGASAGSRFGSHIVFNDGKVLIAAGADVIYLGDVARLDGINDLPEIDAIADISISEDSPEQIVSLTGINAGGGEAQPLRVTASSSDTGLIPDPTVIYSSAESTGTLKFTPVADQSGTATITVTVTDGGLDNDLGTPEDNGVINRTVVVMTEAVNDEPMLDALSDVNINEDAGEQTVNLTGITAGGGETQVLSITAVSDNTGLIPDPTVTFDGQSSTGTLNFTPVADQFGTATITVTVEDGGLDNDLGTSEDNGVINRTVTVITEAVNDAPVLDPAASPQFAAVLEDAGAAIGQVGTLVSALIDAGGTHNNFSDVDGDSPGIAITGVNLQGGSLWFSNDDGATWVDVGAVSNAVPKLLAADATTRLYFQPAANFNGTISDVISFKAWDRITAGWEQLGLDIDGEAAGDYSGNSISLSSDGQTIAIAAYLNDGTGEGAGHVRIYSWTGSSWSQLGADIDGEAAGDQSGASVSLSADGQTVAIGANHNDGNGTDAGHVRIYQWHDSAWLQLGNDIDGELTGDRSGLGVVLSADGQTVAIGAEGNDGSGIDAGHVRIYQWNDSAWQQLGNDIDGEAAGDESGRRVSVSADGYTVAIAARYNDSNGDNSGQVRIYQWSGTDWQQVGVDINGEYSGDESGFDVSLSSDGQTVAISAWKNDGNGFDSGHVRVFEWSGSSWLQLGNDIDGEASRDDSGRSLALSSNGKIIVIGATHNDGNGNNSGHVRIYSWNGSSWSKQGEDIDGEASEDYSGLASALSADGQTVAISAWSNAGNGVNSGHVRIFRLAPTPDSLSTNADTISVTVDPVNDEPTLDALSDVNINEDAGEQTVNLTGITAGGGETQVLSITAVSDNTGLIPDPTVTFDGQSSTGILKLTPVADQFGTATITVTVEDGGLDNDLGTPEDNGVINRTVVIKAEAVNDEPTLDALSDVNINEDDLEQTVNLTGVTAGGGETQVLSITAVSDNTGLIPDPTVTFDGQSSTGTLNFTPVADQFGTATITVTVEDGGLDNDLATSEDNGVINRTVTVITEAVNDEPVLDPAASPQLAAVLEDAAAPSGQVGSLVSDLIDAGGTHNNFSDVDGDLPGIAITGVNLQGGSLWFSNDDGATWVDVGAVSNEAPRLLAANATTRLYFQPAANFNGTISNVISFKAWDRSVIWQQLGLDIDGEESGDSAGYVSISADGQTIAIGGRYNDANGGGSGHVRIYSWTGSSWSQLGADIDGEAAGDQSGISVSLSDDGQTVAIGAYRNDGNGTDSGHVRIYSWDGSGWIQLGEDIDGEAVGDNSGARVRLSGDGLKVAIGAIHNAGNGINSGHVCVYSWDGSGWNQLGEDIDGEAVGDSSGYSLSLSADGQTMAIGAHENDGNGNSSGHVRVYSWDGSAWNQVGVDLDGEEAGDQAGTSVSLSADGQTVAIGATLNDGNGSEAGHVRVYSWDGSAWKQVGVDLDGEEAGDRFGYSVVLAADGQTVAIGSRYNDGNGSDSGHVRIYSWDGSAWSQLGVDIDGEAAGDQAGLDVSFSADGKSVAIGSIYNDSNGSNSGHVRIFRLAPTPDSLSTNTDTISVTVDSVNDAPTLDALSEININEDAPEQTVNLTGITAGGGETQVLSVTAVSDNTGLIPDPTVDFDGQSSTGILKFTPVADQFGTATITVTVEDGGLDNDLGTPEDNGVINRTFTVITEAVNDEPTLDAISDININEDAGEQTINLNGITAGGGETQVLSITATSDNTGLIPDPTVDFDGQSSTGTLKLTPVADQFGTATITVTVTDGGLDDDLGTPDDNGVINRTVTVITEAVNDAPVLDPAASPQLVAVLEDAGAPVGQVGTLVSALIDAGGTHNNFSDVDGDLPGIAITGTNLQGGSLYYSTDDGATWLDVGAVSETSARLLYTDSDTRLAFTPAADFHGSISDVVTLKAWDRTGGYTNGGAGIELAARLDTSGDAVGVTLSADGHMAYVADDEGGLKIINVSDSNAPILEGIFHTTGYATGVVLSADGNTTYVADYSSGLQIIDVSDSSNPTLLGTLDTSGLAWGVALSADGNMAYVADEVGGLQVVNVTDPSAPTLTATLATSHRARDVVLSADGNTAYVADDEGGLQIIDIRDSSAPTLTATLETSGQAYAVRLSADGNTAYVADRTGGLQIVDISDSSNPTLTSTLDTSGLAWSVALSADENTAYVADRTGGLQIVDVSDSSNPALTYTLDTSGEAWGVILSPNGNTAYVADADGGLQIINLGPTGISAASDTVSIEVTSVNDEPTLDALSEVTINEDDLEQTINLTGITAGGGETQELSVTAVSHNTGLIPDPTVTYSSDDPTGTLAFTPVADQFGTATITVTVEDGGLDNDLATTEDNGVINRTVFVAVAPVNDDPTLDELSESTLIEDFGTSTVQLTGITAGPNETQNVRVTAVSSDTNLVTIGEVQYPASSWMNTGRVAHYPLNDTSPDQVIDISASDTSIAGLQDATYTFNFKGSYEGHPAVEDPRYGVFATPAVKMSLQTAAGSYGSHTGDRLYFELPDDRRGTELQPWTTEFFFDVPLDGDTWQTMALVTLANNTAALYVDGVKYFPSSTNRDLPGNWAPSSIGTFSGREVSDFRVYDREISLVDIDELHTGVPDVADILLNSVTDQHGTATVTVTVEDGGLDNDLATPEDNGSILRTVIVKVDSVNDAPTLDPVTDLVIPEDSSTQFVRLSGVTAGGGETQPLRMTTASSNPSLIRNQSVASFVEFDNETRLLAFSPVVNQYGSATITVTIEDGGLDLDLNTAEDNGTVSRSFDVVVESVNDQPTLNPVSNLVLVEDSLTQVLDITGITAGGSENQPLQVTALSSNPFLVLHPAVASRTALGSDTRLLTVTPLPDQYGIATVTVTVEDGGLDLDLNTAEDNATFSQTFDVTITPDTDNPPSPATPHGKMFIHESLSGDSLVSYQLPAVNVNGEAINGLFNRITATSSDAALIPDPTVIYASADVPSSLSFTPVADANGTATLSIQVEDGGPDNDFATTEDNRQATHQVEVNVLEVISNQGLAILAKDSTENLYVNTQPVVYHEQQAQSTIASFAAIGATSENGENTLLVQRSSVTNRLVTDDAWRINGLFDSLRNESSPVLDLSAREVSSTLNVVAISGAYEVNGVNNPTLIVRRGQTYTLNLNVAGHPFYLQTTGSGYQSANIYSGGFAGNGQTSGEHEWVVPEDALDEVFYQCEFHPVMFGKIIVID